MTQRHRTVACAAVAFAVILLAACTPGQFRRDVTAIVSGPTSVAVGSTVQLNVRLDYSDGFTRLLSPTMMNSVEWTSSNTAVASVSFQGIVTGVGPGSATITATPALITTPSGDRIPGTHTISVE